MNTTSCAPSPKEYHDESCCEVDNFSDSSDFTSSGSSEQSIYSDEVQEDTQCYAHQSKELFARNAQNIPITQPYISEAQVSCCQHIMSTSSHASNDNTQEDQATNCSEVSANTKVCMSQPSEMRFLTPRSQPSGSFPVTPKTPSDASPKVIVKFTDIRSGLKKAALSTCIEEANYYLTSPKDLNFKDISKTLCSPAPFKRPPSKRKPDVRPGSASTKAVRKMSFTSQSAGAPQTSFTEREELQDGQVTFDQINLEDSLLAIESVERASSRLKELTSSEFRMSQSSSPEQNYLSQNATLSRMGSYERDARSIGCSLNVANHTNYCSAQDQEFSETSIVHAESSKDSGDTKSTESYRNLIYSLGGPTATTCTLSRPLPVGTDQNQPHLYGIVGAQQIGNPVLGSHSVQHPESFQYQTLTHSQMHNHIYPVQCQPSQISIYSRPYCCTPGQPTDLQPVYTSLQPRTFHPPQLTSAHAQPHSYISTTSYFVPIHRYACQEVNVQDGPMCVYKGDSNDCLSLSNRVNDQRQEFGQESSLEELLTQKSATAVSFSSELAENEEVKDKDNSKNTCNVACPAETHDQRLEENNYKQGWISPQFGLGSNTADMATISNDPMLSSASFEESPKPAVSEPKKSVQAKANKRKRYTYGRRRGTKKRRRATSRKTDSKASNKEVTYTSEEVESTMLSTQQGYELVDDTNWNTDTHDDDGVLSTSNMDAFAKNQPTSVLLSGLNNHSSSLSAKNPQKDHPSSLPKYRITSLSDIKNPRLKSILLEEREGLLKGADKDDEEVVGEPLVDCSGIISQTRMVKMSETTQDQNGETTTGILRAPSSECRNPKKEMIERQMLEERESSIVNLDKDANLEKGEFEQFGTAAQLEMSGTDPSLAEPSEDPEEVCSISDTESVTVPSTTSTAGIPSSLLQPENLCSVAGTGMDTSSLQKLVEYQAQYISMLQGMHSSYMTNMYMRYAEPTFHPTALHRLPLVVHTVPRDSNIMPQNQWMPRALPPTILPANINTAPVWTAPVQFNQQSLPLSLPDQTSQVQFNQRTAQHQPLFPPPGAGHYNHARVPVPPLAQPLPVQYNLQSKAFDGLTMAGSSVTMQQNQNSTTVPNNMVNNHQQLELAQTLNKPDYGGDQQYSKTVPESQSLTQGSGDVCVLPGEQTCPTGVNTMQSYVESCPASVESVFEPVDKDSSTSEKLGGKRNNQESAVHHPILLSRSGNFNKKGQQPRSTLPPPTRISCPKPRHFVLTAISIGSFQYDASGSCMAPKLKIIFSRRRLIYEMEWAGGLVNGEGSARARMFTAIEVPFSSIVGLCASSEGHDLLVEVKVKPLMYMGSKPCDQMGKSIPHKVVTYNRTKSTDFTNDQLSTIPYHQLQLQHPYVAKVIQALEDFDKEFRLRVNPCLTLDPDKRLELDIGTLEQPHISFMCTARSETSEPVHQMSTSARQKKKLLCNPCSCMGGCQSSRCRCVQRQDACTPLCACFTYLRNCSNPINQLEIDMEVDHEKVKSDPCLMANIYRIKQLSEYLNKQVTLPCCSVAASLKQCVPGKVLCPMSTDTGCQKVYQYSWCTGKLHDETLSKRNHCAVCDRCMNSEAKHCKECNQCFIPYADIQECLCKSHRKQEEEVTSTCTAELSRLIPSQENTKNSEITIVIGDQNENKVKERAQGANYDSVEIRDVQEWVQGLRSVNTPMVTSTRVTEEGDCLSTMKRDLSADGSQIMQGDGGQDRGTHSGDKAVYNRVRYAGNLPLPSPAAQSVSWVGGCEDLVYDRQQDRPHSTFSAAQTYDQWGGQDVAPAQQLCQGEEHHNTAASYYYEPFMAPKNNEAPENH